MELVRGASLHEMIRVERMPADRFVPLLERLCEVVQSAHEQGIVHRDLKPSNVMVIARSGRLLPKLLDFGIAKSVGDPRASHATMSSRREPSGAALDHTLDASGGLTHEGHLLGSPAYMAPEQWLDAGRVGPRTDQYALAILAFEVLTGARPFHASTIDAMLAAHRDAPLPRATLSPEVHAVLARAAAKRPEERFGDLHEFGRALRLAIAGPAEIELPIALPGELVRWSEAAPPPIAQAIVALLRPRGPRHASRVASPCPSPLPSRAGSARGRAFAWHVDRASASSTARPPRRSACSAAQRCTSVSGSTSCTRSATRTPTNPNCSRCPSSRRTVPGMARPRCARSSSPPAVPMIGWRSRRA